MVQIVGDRVRRLREAKGLSQGQLAYKADTTSSQISRLENDSRPGAQAVLIARIAQELDTNIDYLLGLTDDPTSWEPRLLPDLNGIDPEARELVNELLALHKRIKAKSPAQAQRLRQIVTLQAEALLAALEATEQEEQPTKSLA